MGQHKNNPTAIKAKEGKLHPKKRGPGKHDRDKFIRDLIWKRLFGNF